MFLEAEGRLQYQQKPMKLC